MKEDINFQCFVCFTEANGKGAIPKVTEVKVDEVTDSSITISWSKPDDSHRISAYRVTCADKDAGNEDGMSKDDTGRDKGKGVKGQGDIEVSESPQEILVDDVDVTSATFSELGPGRMYALEVFAVYGDKESEETTLEVETSKIFT